MLFGTFLCSPCMTTTWNDQILSLLGNGNGKAINSTISFSTWVRSLLFSSNPYSLLLSKWAPWNNREKKRKDAKSILQRRFQGKRRYRIVRSLLGGLCNDDDDDGNKNCKKNNRFRRAKQQLCTCITLFCTFPCRRCTTTTWNCLISRFIEDGNKRQQLSLFFLNFDEVH